MPRDGNGGYTLPAGNPVVAGTTITDAWANVTIADLANEIAGSMTIDGQTPLTGPLKFAAGSVSSPSVTFNVESNTGLYRPALQALAVTVNGSEKVRFTAASVQPGSNNTLTLGTSGLRWNTVYATTFDGVATSARYADLAEKYHSDFLYTPGTIVRVDGEYEITQETADCSPYVFGVVSSQPGFMLNSAAGYNTEEIWLYVALSGRVPVRVVGTVQKGDYLVSAGRGLARAATLDEVNDKTKIGVALADKTDHNEGLVLVAVR